MAIKDIVRSNGDKTSLPVKREDETSLPSLYREMNDWMHSWNRWFEGFFNRPFDFTPALAGRWTTFTPAINFSDGEHEFKLTAELPGMEQKDIHLTISRDTLVISGEKKAEHEEKGAGFYRAERTYGMFKRSIPLPEEVDTGKVDATFKNGVLTVTLPKLPEKPGAKKIEIKS